ncbi:MAG: type II toxin-antitoxin system VapC family toxin [Desulfotignum sp.]|nr:type II toxin-antitoxin system VapC family toxin [Desulfotignum sp.]MCF8088600.1 type II toxin-antitoxin system VapC family toxin [Desulfotignum sp.]MCF8137958.1 type II toxin-antitoxin system VapC family toxin [Desulfotignum sp.]
MKKALVDTNIISAFMRGNPSVIQKVEKYLRFHKTLSVSVITYYEIIRGLKATSNINKLQAFETFMSACEILNLDSLTAEKAAEIYDALRKKGNLVEDADILIAATAITNDLIVVTDNTRHFDRINGLEISNWLQTPSSC